MGDFGRAYRALIGGLRLRGCKGFTRGVQVASKRLMGLKGACRELRGSNFPGSFNCCQKQILALGHKEDSCSLSETTWMA